MYTCGGGAQQDFKKICPVVIRARSKIENCVRTIRWLGSNSLRGWEFVARDTQQWCVSLL